MLICFLSLFVSIQASDEHVKVLSITVFFICCMLLLITCTFLVSNNGYPLASDTDNTVWMQSGRVQVNKKMPLMELTNNMKVLVCTTSLPMVSWQY